jgi:cytochrome c oxidase assembly protein subunit 15
VTWIPGTLFLGALLSGLGALVGRASAKAAPPPRRWSSSFARVAAFATLLLLALGGIVTGNEAGLAVPDWPDSFQSNMFVYPLSRMTGGIYYEHAHRLFGSLVGLTTLVLMIVLFLDDTRRWLRTLGVVAFVLVVTQGVLGGWRVTNTSVHLAVVHGITAQVFFGVLVAITAFTSKSWRTAPPPTAKGEAAEDMISGSTFLVGAVLVQLLLGALVRHLHLTVTWHITMAIVVVVLAIANGVRARTHADQVALPKLGMALIHVVGLQFLLGVFALAVTASEGSAIASAQVPITTLHQTCGALVLAVAVLLWVWSHRVLDPAEPPKSPETSEPSTESVPSVS